MGSQNLKYDCEAIVDGILEEYTKKLRVNIDDPKAKQIKKVIVDTLNSNGVSHKSEVIDILAQQDFLSNLSEDIFVDLFVILPSWFYNIVANFLEEIEKAADDDCVNIDPESPLACIVAMTNFLCFSSKSKHDISVHTNLTVSEIGLKTVRDCYYNFRNLNKTKQYSLKESIGKLVQQCKNLQRCILYFFEHTNLVSSKDEVKYLLASCSNTLVQLLIFISDVNPTEVAPILKVLGVILNNSSDDLKDGLDIVSFVEYLSNSTIKFITPLLSSHKRDKPNSYVANKSNKAHILKICNYQLKILILTCDKMRNYLENSWPNLVRFLMYLIELMPLRQNMFKDKNGRTEFYLESDNEDDKVTENITIGMEPLLMNLISDREFMYNVLQPRDNVLAQCLLIVHILDKIPDLEYEVFEMWLKYTTENGDSALKFLFKLIERLYFEFISPVYVPGIMLKGKPPIFNSLYHHLCTHICGFVASLPSEHFTIAEDVLLESLLSDSIWLNILASDVWCFLSRYATPNLCAAHCNVLLQLHLQLPHDSNILSLLAKLFSFLSKTQQSQFLKDYSVEKYVKVWSYLPTNDDIKSSMGIYYTKVKVDFEKETSVVDNMTIGHKFRLIQLFETHIPTQVTSGIVSKFLTNYLSDILTFKSTFQEWILCRIASCIYVMSINVFNDSTECICRILESLGKFLNSNMEKMSKHCLTLLILLLLKSLNSKNLPTKLLETVTSCFTYALTNSNYILKCIAFENLVIFARVTPHKMLLKNILKSDCKAHFTQFLQQIPYDKILTVDETKNLASYMLNNKELAYVPNVNQSQDNGNDNGEEIYEHPSKKPRIVESDYNSSMSLTISNLQHVQQDIEKAWIENCMSPSDSKKIRVIVEKILEYV